jgi:basic amino acid/polyamine antiporter, APA family
MALKLFRKKSPDLLLAEAAAPERQLKRTLGPIALTAIGIGAGIFSLTGTAAAGQHRSSFDSANRCITEDNLCRFIGHTSASLQKDFLGVD